MAQEKNEQKKQRNKRSARKTRSRPSEKGRRKARKRVLSPPENREIAPDLQEGRKLRRIFSPLLFSGFFSKSTLKNTKKYNSFRCFIEYLPVFDTRFYAFPTAVGFVRAVRGRLREESGQREREKCGGAKAWRGTPRCLSKRCRCARREMSERGVRRRDAGRKRAGHGTGGACHAGHGSKRR